ncbi:hydroxyacid-oxoacid transhydrogenase [Micromonospora profundi]|uniref:hydroxyacid-oxoacid transhydrogenase n=1 Tax=Micromonospora profundi TaxID=1420889 RepID=UPI0033A560A9
MTDTDPNRPTIDPGNETVITFEAPRLVMGNGATEEIGSHLLRLGIRSTLIVTDPVVAGTGLPRKVQALLDAAGIEADCTEGATVEPTDASCEALFRELSDRRVHSFVAVGGGSAIDTAKVLNLMVSYPDVPLHDYLNRPIGIGRSVPGPLKPLIAVPTTAGSGSECTAMVALGLVEYKVKTGIADRALTPTLAIVDPLNTVTAPPAVTAAGGYDVLTHACESYTSRAYDRRVRPASPGERAIYIGANPISDIWVEQALRLLGDYFVRAVLNPHDIEARVAMSRAAVYAGMGFGNAGTHIPHACAYPIAGLVTGYRPRDYVVDHSMVPHGEAVVATAPAAFEYTYPAAPERHLRAAELLGASTAGISIRSGHDLLPAVLAGLVRLTGGPAGISSFGFESKDVPALVEGAVKQQRLLVGCPRDVGPDELRQIFDASMGAPAEGADR